MASTGVSEAREDTFKFKRRSNDTGVDFAKWLPFILSLFMFIGGYYALRQEVADMKESMSDMKQELKQDIRDLQKEVLYSRNHKNDN